MHTSARTLQITTNKLIKYYMDSAVLSPNIYWIISNNTTADHQESVELRRLLQLKWKIAAINEWNMYQIVVSFTFRVALFWVSFNKKIPELLHLITPFRWSKKIFDFLAALCVHNNCSDTQPIPSNTQITILSYQFNNRRRINSVVSVETHQNICQTQVVVCMTDTSTPHQNDRLSCFCTSMCLCFHGLQMCYTRWR